MELRQLFRNIHNVYSINTRPQKHIKRLLEYYNYEDWKQIKHFYSDFYGNNIFKLNYFKTPILFNQSQYFDMYLIGFPPKYITDIHNHNTDCFFKILEGSVTDNRYNLSKLTGSSIIYKNAPIIEIGYVKKTEFHSIENKSDIPAYTINIYSKM